jgi:hypothetical protein
MSSTPWKRRPVDFFVKQLDTAPVIAFQLLDGTGAPVVLTGATVKFMMQAPGDANPKINAAATITDAATGKVSYTWSGTNTDTIGDYLAEWQVTFGGGAVETFPNGEILKVRILDDIAT